MTKALKARAFDDRQSALAIANKQAAETLDSSLSALEAQRKKLHAQHEATKADAEKTVASAGAQYLREFASSAWDVLYPLAQSWIVSASRSSSNTLLAQLRQLREREELELGATSGLDRTTQLLVNIFMDLYIERVPALVNFAGEGLHEGIFGDDNARVIRQRIKEARSAVVLENGLRDLEALLEDYVRIVSDKNLDYKPDKRLKERWAVLKFLG